MDTYANNQAIRLAFGEVLARHRIAAGFDQRPFSRAVGISNSYLRKIEQGETSPTLVTLSKIAMILGVTPGALVVEMDDYLRERELTK